MAVNDLTADTRKTAELLGVSVRTLLRMRRDGDGPRYVRIGTRVVYPLHQIEVWLATRSRERDVNPRAELTSV